MNFERKNLKRIDYDDVSASSCKGCVSPGDDADEPIT
jgi:hypothetical protein